jgi:capsular exopolysaccharide synthesis family protein
VESPTTNGTTESPRPNSAPSAAPAADWFGLDVASYWRTIRKRSRLILLVAATIVGGVLVWTYRQPKIYEGRCSILINPAPPQVLAEVREIVELGSGGFLANQEYIQTQYRIIRSKELAKRVVERLGLAADVNYPYPGAGNERKDRDVAAIVVANTRVMPVKDSRIANIVVEDREAERAARIANALAETYIEHNLQFKLEGTREATDWLDEQLADLRGKARESDLALYQYRTKNQLLDVDLDARQNMTTQNVQAFNQKLTDARVRRLELEARRKLILEARDNIEEQESLPDIRSNQVIQMLRGHYFDLNKTKADVDTKYGDKHPTMVALETKIAVVKRDYIAEINKVLKSNDKEYAALVEYEKSLEKMMDREKKEAIKLSMMEIEYRPLSRDSENTQKMFGLVLNRQKEATVTGFSRSNNVRIFERAETPRAPARPNVLVNLGIALVVGLVFGLGSAGAAEVLDNTIKNHEQAESLVGAPVLGIVPIIGDRKSKAAKGKGGRPIPKIDVPEQQKRDLGVYYDPKSLAAEACRSIRTNLLFLSPSKPLRSIVVTSPGPQEGKTTTAINLAITLAQAGAKVLLVDTDLRRPRIHRSFQVSNERGISSVIVGETELGAAVIHTDVPNLDLLPCGPIPPNPAELLQGDRFRAIMKECAQKYDRVIYDSPPTSAVTDPALIGNLADGVVLVLRARHTTRQAAAFARRQLTDAKATMLGTILNRVDPSDRRYEYYYAQYYRSYGYGYGGYYGTTEQSAKV